MSKVLGFWYTGVMKKIIGVMGPGEDQATKQDLQSAYEVGKIIAENDLVLLCGGRSGTMEVSAKGAQEHGGLTIGVGPTGNKSDMNPHVDIPLLTNMHAGRNYMNIISSDVLVFVSVGSPGTLSELAFAIQMKKPSIVINGTEKLETYINEISEGAVIFASSVEEVKKFIEES